MVNLELLMADGGADQVRKLSTLVDVARNLTSCRSTSDVINQVLGSAMTAIETAGAGIFYLFDEAAGLLKVQTAVGFTDQVYQLQMLPGESMSGRAFASGESALYRNQDEIIAVMSGQSAGNLSAMTQATGGATFPRSALAVPLKLTGQAIGVIVLDNFTRSDAFAQSDLSLLQSLADQAAIAIDNVRLYERQSQLVAQLEQALFEAEVRGKRDLIDELLLGKQSLDLERAAKAIGIDPAAATVCLWMDIDQFSRYLAAQRLDERAVQQLKQRLYQGLNTLVRSYASSSFVSLKNDEFIVFLKLPQVEEIKTPALARTIAQQFQAFISDMHPGLTISIAISGVIRGMPAVIEALTDLRRMVELHQRNQQHGRIFFARDLGAERLLLQFPDTQALVQFAGEVLERVADYDKTGNNDLIKTLSAYCENSRNIADTARMLHMHQNTVRYRLDRAKELIGHEDWFTIELALRIYRLTGRMSQ